MLHHGFCSTWFVCLILFVFTFLLFKPRFSKLFFTFSLLRLLVFPRLDFAVRIVGLGDLVCVIGCIPACLHLLGHPPSVEADDCSETNVAPEHGVCREWA